VDLADPTNPTLLGSGLNPEWLHYAMSQENGTLYVLGRNTSTHDNAVLIYDLADPSSRISSVSCGNPQAGQAVFP